MPVAGALIAAGGSIIGGQTAARAQDRATRAQTAAERRAIDAQLSMFQQQRADQMPWMQAGASSLAQIARILGLPQQTSTVTTPGGSAGIDPSERLARLDLYDRYQQLLKPISASHGAGAAMNIARTNQAEAMLAENPWLTTFNPNDPASDIIGTGSTTTIPAPSTPFDMTALLRSTPGYDFTRNEAMRGIERSAAARGGLNSGATLRALAQYNTGLADQTYNNYLNRLFSVAGLGQSSTGQIGAAGQATGANIAQNLSNIGQARSSSYANQGNIWGNAIGSAFNAFGQYYNQYGQYNNRPPQTGTVSPT